MNQVETNQPILDELTELIAKSNAHLSFEEAVKDLPASKRTETVDNLPYSIWQLVEHIRIAQWDILEFCRDPEHKSPEWPEGYWPENPDRVDDDQWQKSLDRIRTEREKFLNLLRSNDLFKPLEHGSGQNLFREALLIADHCAYHTGEIVVVRRLLKAW